MKPSPWWLALALAGGVTAAHAGLFDDEEARKAIGDLRARVAAMDDQAKARAEKGDAASAQLADQLSAVQRSLLDLSGQLQDMRSDIAKLRGDDEQLARDLANLQSRQKDMGQAFDDRLRKLEPVKVTLDGKEFAADPDQKRAYEDALAAIRGGDFEKSANLLASFQSRYPVSPYTDSVRFWLGNALYGKTDYKGAITAFRAFVAGAPDNPHAPDAMLALANCQAELKDVKGARRTLEQLIKTYPGSDAAHAGKDRLASIH
jgi:tol-pal system protein YbgF